MSTTLLPEGAPTPGPGSPERQPWYRRRAVLVTAGVVAVLVTAVLTDLPVHTSKSQDIASGQTVMKELNGDVAGCALAAHESIFIWQSQQHHTLSPSDYATTPSLLRDDQTACSFTNEDIFNLSNIEVPGSPSGKHLEQVVSATTLWATSDALAAIEDIQTLMTHPADAASLANLAKAERQLAADRSLAEERLTATDKLLGTRLPTLVIPALPTPSGG